MTQEKNITILYVDDEEINLFLFNASFQDKYKVLTATSGSEGLDQLKMNHDDIIVVISDMNMPAMNGVEFIKKARDSDYNSIAYFILTGYDYNEEIDDAIKQNVVQKFFTKPFNTEQIEKAIAEVYEKSM